MSADTITYTFESEQRIPLVVVDGWIDAGGQGRRFKAGNRRSLLTSYVKLVRSMRKAHPRTTVNLRVGDVTVLAAYLNESPESVVDGLADVIGAPRIERPALVSMLAGGAAVVTLVTASSFATVARPSRRTPDTHQATVVPDRTVDHAPTAAGGTSAATPPTRAPQQQGTADAPKADTGLFSRSHRMRGFDLLRRPAAAANVAAREFAEAAVQQSTVSDRELAEYQVDNAPIIVVVDEDGNEGSVFTPPLPPA